MMKKIFTLFCLTLLFACQDSNDQNNSDNEEKDTITASPEVIESNDEEIKTIPELKDAFKSQELVALVNNSSFSYLMYRGSQVGFEYELLKMFCEDHGLKLKIKVVKDAAHILDSLNVGYGHIAASNFAITTKRKELVEFSLPFFRTRQILVQKKPTNWRKMTVDNINKALVQDPLDLSEKTIVVKKNSSFATNIRDFAYENGLNILVHDADKLETTEDLIELVDQGEVDYTIVDENTIDFFKALYPDLDFSTPVSFNQNIAWAINKKSSTLVESVNNWIKKNKGGSRFNILNNRYFNINYSDRRRLQKAWNSKVGIISEYDGIIKEYSAKQDLDWILMSALIFQESKFNKKAKSWVGARGLTQMMPRTATEYGIHNPNLLYVPKTSVDVGTRFYKNLYEFWEPIVGDSAEAHRFCMASYNAGKGHVLDARRLAQKHGYDNNVWFGNVEKMMLAKSNPAYYNDNVVKFGYCVGKEPVNYVKNIEGYYELFKQYLTQKE